MRSSNFPEHPTSSKERGRSAGPSGGNSEEKLLVSRPYIHLEKSAEEMPELHLVL